MLKEYQLRAQAHLSRLQRMAHPALQPISLHRASQLIMCRTYLFPVHLRRLRKNVNTLFYSQITLSIWGFTIYINPSLLIRNKHNDDLDLYLTTTTNYDHSSPHVQIRTQDLDLLSHGEV